jgi:hypothetical protein
MQILEPFLLVLMNFVNVKRDKRGRSGKGLETAQALDSVIVKTLSPSSSIQFSSK